MSYVPIPELQDIRTFEDEPIMSRKVYTYGVVNIYAPDAPSEEWAERAWLITSELDSSGNPPGIRVEIKAEAVAECLAKPHFINKSHMFA